MPALRDTYVTAVTAAPHASLRRQGVLDLITPLALATLVGIIQYSGG